MYTLYPSVNQRFVTDLISIVCNEMLNKFALVGTKKI